VQRRDREERDAADAYVKNDAGKSAGTSRDGFVARHRKPTGCALLRVMRRRACIATN